MPKQYVLKAEAATVNVTPFGFHAWASQFLHAANAVDKTADFSPVRYFLVCRSIELGLKAYLLAKGESKKFLKNNLRHSLDRILTSAEAKGLQNVIPLTTAEKALVRAASSPYASKFFEYFEVVEIVAGFRSRPDIDKLSAIAEKIVSGVRQTCLDAA